MHQNTSFSHKNVQKILERGINPPDPFSAGKGTPLPGPPPSVPLHPDLSYATESGSKYM